MRVHNLALIGLASAAELVVPRQANGSCQQDLAELALYAKNLANYAQTLAAYASQFATELPLNGSSAASIPSANQTTVHVSLSTPRPSSAAASTLSTFVSSTSAASSTAAKPTSSAAPSAAANSSTPAGSGSITSTYTQYKGDGTAAQGWPDLTKWVKDFSTMWGGNVKILGSGCAQFGADVNSQAENQDIHDAILSVATTANLDPRFLLAIIMQESGGCVRVWTTTSPDGKVTNPGIMQDHDGAGSCNKNPNQKTDKSQMQTPCPQAQILQMIKDGTLGTSGGDGLQQTYGKSPGSDAQKYYQAARMYNSGSLNKADLGDGISATNCYASDVANRLAGWVGDSPCKQGTVN
jgi:hypothetical protein